MSGAGPRHPRAIDTKVWRDVRALWGQLVAIALVITCGVGLFLGMRATMRSLEAARSSYYAQERFANVFARLTRAPERIADRIADIDGVERWQTRVVADVTLDVPDMREVATGRLTSIPEQGEGAVNGLRLRSGRLPEPGRGDEVVVGEAFADAHRLALGSHLGAILNGRRQSFRVVGTGLSPEYLFKVGPGQLVPDDRMFGVLWMRRDALAAAFDMVGAFNDVVIQVGRGTSVDAVIDRVDDLLGPYGGVGAIARSDQISAFFIENELKQLATFGLMVPSTFLFVAALLLNVVVGRIVASQREQIAALKALGYYDREVGLHFAKGVAGVLAVGSLGGVALATWIGSSMVELYTEYYRFPELPFVMRAADLVLALGLSAGAAALGAFASIARSVRLPPAEGMRPAGPASYRPTVLERMGWWRLMPSGARMVLRELERRPLRALLSALGIALATALIVLSTFSFDAMRYMMNVQFGLQQRADAQIALFQPRDLGALSSLRALPAVRYVEPYREVPVRLHNGPRKKGTTILAVPARAELYAVLDADLREIPLPDEGVVLSRKLAEMLDAHAGERIEIEVLEGARKRRRVPVARVAETFVGLQAYMSLEAVSRMLGSAPSMSGAWLLVDDRELDRLHQAVKSTPLIAGLTTRHRALGSLQDILDRSLGTSLAFSVGFALVMALGVLYNAARITFAERVRDLASLRVLGFRRAEVSRMLLGEIALLAVVGTPLGLVMGHGLAATLVASPGFESDQLRIPFVIDPSTYALAVATVVVATGLAGFAAWRRLDRVDIIDVLKTPD